MVAPGRLQHTLTSKYHSTCAAKLSKSMEDAGALAEQLTLQSARQPNASLWLTVIPTEPAYQLNSNEMRSALRMRLHLPPVRLDSLRTTACPCSAGDLSEDPLLAHLCARIRRRATTKRHDLVLRVLTDVARELSIPCDVEKRSEVATD